MSTSFSVSLKKIVSELSLEVAYMPAGEDDIEIKSVDVNRPGLQLAGFFNRFDNTRVQIFGRSEMEYLDEKTQEERISLLEQFFQQKPVAIIITRSIRPMELMISLAKKYDIPLMLSSMPTSNFFSRLNSFLNHELAPRVTQHGVFVEVYGEGVLLVGDSGVGKSETAIELVKRGHILVADDSVELRRVDEETITGAAPENIRHFLELRGIGIVNVRQIFGVGAVKVSTNLDMIISLEPWEQSKVYDRLGLEDEFTDILGLKIPKLTIPIKPGRNLAIIIEVAAMNNRQKRLGYNAAQDLLKKLGMLGDLPESANTDAFSWG